ncbi:hypothetical protein [Acinetobacter baumannii]|uniref:hypothetical protein n=2 Tax=Acinetobacter baumannii TaxID=470 RepID=UPI003891C6CF
MSTAPINQRKICMIKVIHLEGKFILVDDEYVLSVQASIISTKDEDGYIPNEFFEFVKILDEDEFEIDEVGLSFNPLYPNKESFSTNIFIWLCCTNLSLKAYSTI